MRITKVKANVNGIDDTIQIYRTNEAAKLMGENDSSKKDQTDNLLPKEKIKNFKESLKNKTVVKSAPKPSAPKSKEQKNRLKSIHKDVGVLVDNLLYSGRVIGDSLKKAKLEEIALCLKEPFNRNMTYHKAQCKKVSFNLAKGIYDAARGGIAPDIQGYIDYKNHFIKRKAESLKKSITENRLTTVLNLDAEPKSKRQQALKIWVDEYLGNKKCDIDLSECERIYEIDDLVAKLNGIVIPTFEADKDDKKKQRINDEKRYNYCCALKKKLNEHRKLIFGFGDDAKNRDNVQLMQYQEELKKYMERNFPLKGSNRKLSPEMIRKFLRELSIKDAIKNQLINIIRHNLIDEGRSQHLGYNGSTTSTELQNTKINENFFLKFLDACSFAGNSICNVIGYTGDKDIVNTCDNEFASSIKDTGRLILFYPYAQYNENLLWAMRGSVSRIRNQMVHFRKEALDKIGNISDFGTKDNRIPFKNNKFVKIFKAEIGALPAVIAKKLKTAHILTYYSQEDLIKLFGEYRFHLAGSVVPFAPSYGNVYKHGAKYQDAQDKKGGYSLNTKFYISNQKSHNADEKEELRLARYNLLKLVYNYQFLKLFTGNDNTAFRKAVNDVISKNKKYAEYKKPKNQAYAFHDIREMGDESVTDYMRYVHSTWTQELVKKKNQKADQAAHKEASINCANFVLQVFIKGFDTYLQDKNNYDIILHPAWQLDDDKEQADWLNEAAKNLALLLEDKIILSEKEHKDVGFYLFCKLLDANHLSTLRNELIKYEQSPCTDKLPTTLKEMLDGWKEIIEICLLSADQIPDSYKKIEHDPDNFMKRITPYVEVNADLKQWSELFYQSDKATPIVHAPVEIALKYGTAKILQLLMERNPTFRVSKAEFDEWTKKKGEIAKWVKERDKLHTCWIEAKAKDSEEKKNKVPSKKEEQFFKAHQKGYEELCDYIDRYNYLDNRVHLQHLTRLHNLLIDLLGRMIGFTHFWERDFRMVYANLKEYRGVGPELNFDKELPKIKDKEFKNLYDRTILSPQKTRNRDTRNYIAHLNYLTTGADRSLIDLVHDLRSLTEYDRKLKNAVCKAIIKVFEQYGMDLKFKVNDNHRFGVEPLESKQIRHLGGKVETAHVTKEFCNMCYALLNLKSK